VSSAAAGLGEKRRDTICIGEDSPISMAANLGVYKSRTSVTKKFRYMGYSFKVM
jgi:hypothetical protein